MLRFQKSLYKKTFYILQQPCQPHQWLSQMSIKLPYAVLRRSALKFTKGRKRENSKSYYFLFGFHQNLISRVTRRVVLGQSKYSLLRPETTLLVTLLSCLSEKTLSKVESESEGAQFWPKVVSWSFKITTDDIPML